ncbi:MAG: tetratricopeptide repeat protein, partial [Candidatus Poribacteria bacterium]|nr:tetratricopeptide repeat protein [Candidatus Poribacteria bacterium]
MAGNNRNMNKFFRARSEIALLSTFRARSKHARHVVLLCGAILTALVQPVDAYVNDEAALQLYDEGLRDAFRGEVDGAVSAFKQATKLDDTLADAHAYLGMLYGIRGEWKDAIQAFQDAIEADPTYVEVYT